MLNASTVILFTAAVLAAPTISQAAMGVDYHENARSICQVRAHLKAGKRFPVDPKKLTKIRQINGLRILLGRRRRCWWWSGRH